MLSSLVRVVFNAAILPFTMWVWVGMNVWGKSNVPRKGPAIVVANHNSHFDTLAIMALFPRRMRSRIRPVAAEDYFANGGLMTWFSLSVLRGITIRRASGGGLEDPFAKCHEALAKGDILIVYPEGTRGKPEVLSDFKKGIAYLAARHSTVPVIPINLEGLGTVMGKGHSMPMPFFCDVVVGGPFVSTGMPAQYVTELKHTIIALQNERAN